MRLVFALLTVGLVLLPSAHAQTTHWQKFQPAHIGFSVDMPDTPTLKTQQLNGRSTYSATVAFDKASAGADLVFIVKYQNMDKTPGSETEGILDKVVKAVGEGNKVLFINKEMLSGYPARRFGIEDSDKATYEMRSVITDRAFIQAIFVGPVGNPLGKRFLDSFAVQAAEE